MNITDRDFKSKAQSRMWWLVPAPVRWKQTDQAIRTVRNHLKRDPDWIQEYKLGDYYLDFYHPRARVCVEVDGAYHHRSSHYISRAGARNITLIRAQADVDQDRDDYLAGFGIVVIRIQNYQTEQKEVLGRLIDQIRQTVLSRLGRAPAPPSRPGEYIARVEETCRR
jgi:very-short-patch-repair endonuclease